MWNHLHPLEAQLKAAEKNPILFIVKKLNAYPERTRELMLISNLLPKHKIKVRGKQYSKKRYRFKSRYFLQLK